MPATIIYAVTSGEYSDYGIEGVFSTRSLAEGFIEKQDEEDRRSFDIAEWVLDEKRDHVKRMEYRAILGNDGNVGESYETNREVFAGPNDRGESETSEGYSTGISYISAEHAKKLAVEA